MADNRIFLAHTGVDFCLFLGKTLGYQPWYNAPTKEKMEDFYDLVFQEAGTEGKYFLFDEDDSFYRSGVGGEGKHGFNKLLTR